MTTAIHIRDDVNEEEQFCSSIGNHILAVFKQPESYQCLKSALADIISDVEQLHEITVSGLKFEITYYLGGDWKFLATVTGIDSASSTYSCIWCKCRKDERGDIHRRWSLTDPENGARTTDENQRIGERSRKQYNVSNPPLFTTIPLKNVVIDNLHLFLRVSDVLIDLLIVELRRQDAIEKVKKFTSTDLSRYQHIQKYQEFVSSLGIPGFEFYIGRSSKELKCRSLTGPEKLKLLQKIDIQSLLPNFDASQCQAIQHLWKELLCLNSIISKPACELPRSCIAEFEQRARKWGEDFIGVYQRCHVTPYIHAFMNHVGEFMTIHGSILPFNQQALEKKNDVITKIFFRSSNHQGDTALRQIIEKQNRLEHLESVGVKKIKLREIQCSNCKTEGHNRLTCPAPCQMCTFTPYKDHLTDDKKKTTCDKEN